MHSDENDALSAVTLSSYPHYALVYLGYGHTTIEIINNARGGIEGKIGERDVWGGGKFKSRMFTNSRCPRQKRKLQT